MMPRVGLIRTIGPPATWLRLIVAVLMGAASMHVIEYHLGIGVRGGLGAEASAAIFMLAHCPMRAPLLVISLIFLTGLWIILRSMHREMRLLEDLTRPAGSTSEPSVRQSIDWWRVPLVALPLAATQWMLFALAGRIVPMDYVMRVQGGHMIMAVTPPVPVPLLALCLGFIASLVLVFLGRKLEELSRAISERIRALYGELRSSERPVFPLVARPQHALLGFQLFSRPPPVSSPASLL